MTKQSILQSIALSAILLAVVAQPSRAQDSNGTSPLTSLDTSAHSYDILVDSSLAQDNPGANQYRTLQAAYAAAPAGTATRQTVIGLKPDVYFLEDPTNPTSSAGINITKNYITLVGLTNDHRNVVLAGNRGNNEGSVSGYDGFVVNVSADGFQAINLTFLNACNIDYQYPGNSAKNLAARSYVITQAVAIQATGDKHYYDHVAFLSRLDTTFFMTTRAYFSNVFIEGTDDFIGGGTISVWKDSVLSFPTGSGIPTVSGTVFINTTFTTPAGGMFQFYKYTPSGDSLPAVLINCTLPAISGQNVAWVRGYAPAMLNQYSLTYHNKDANGNPLGPIPDGSQGPIAYNLSRELSDTEALAFNSWNLLRATPTDPADDWDPAGVKAYYENLGQGSLPYGIYMDNGFPSVVTNGATATVTATVLPARAPATITWSTTSGVVHLDKTVGPSVVVSGNNQTGASQYAAVNATASNGFYTTAYPYVDPAHIAAPAISGVKLSAPFNQTVTVSYQLNPANRPDQSIVSWFSCDDASGSNPRPVGISNGSVPLQTYTLQLGDVGRYLMASIQPAVSFSDTGTAVTVTATAPIALTDIKTTTVSPNFANFPPTTNANYLSGYWTVLGSWTSQAAPTGSTYANGYGIRVAQRGSSLLLQQDAAYGDMLVNVLMSPEKTAGQGFGSSGQKADLFIKYDPRTQNGYSLRWWRIQTQPNTCQFQLYQFANGTATPVSSTFVANGAFKPNTYVTLSIVGSTFTAYLYNTVDSNTVSLTAPVTPNTYGGTGLNWDGTVPSGNSNVISYFQVSYPGTAKLGTTATLSKIAGGYQAAVTVKNSGTAIAQNVQLSTAALGNANGNSLPISFGNIAPGGSATTTVTFPASAGSSGSAVVEKYAGIYTGGSFSASIRAALP
jgi:hypothetical protein